MNETECTHRNDLGGLTYKDTFRLSDHSIGAHIYRIQICTQCGEDISEEVEDERHVDKYVVED